MAQTGFTPISIYYSSTATNVPTAGNLVAGELAINTADGKLFYKDSAGVVQVIGTKGGVGSSSTTQVLYNSSGLVVGSANMTFSGTALTLANDASISGLTVGKGGGTVSTNTAVGYQAINATATGIYNVGVGYSALSANTSGEYNTAVGGNALQISTTGVNNSAFGLAAMAFNTSGGSNTALGMQALRSNTTASDNVAVGYQALYSTVTGNACTAVGTGALYSNTAAENSAFGRSALNANTSGTNNTALGQASLAGNTTGNYNAAGGRASLLSNTTGANNTAFGTDALRLNTTASNNTAVGYQAGLNNVTGANNLFVGMNAGNATTSGNNTIVGRSAGESVSSGGFNTLIGNLAGANITSGAKNTVLGRYDGNQGSLDIRTASNYIVLSDGDGNPLAYVQNAVNNWYQKSNSTLWSITSDARIKKNIVSLESGLSVVSALRPVEFDYIANDKHDIGFIAQEYQTVLPAQISEGKDGVLSLNQNLVPYLVKAIQELKAEFDAYKATHS